MGLFPASIKQNAPPSNERWSWWMSLFVLCAILGALMGLSFKTQNTIRLQDLPSGNYAGLAESFTALKVTLKQGLSDRDRTIAALQLQIQKLQVSDPSDTRQEKLLSDNLTQANFLAGLTEVQGPGIIVTLTDSKHTVPGAPPAAIMPGLIHDTDINQTVNELKAAGAEAISINDQRLVATSPIRCAGPTVLVNAVPQPPPYVIRAIGNPNTLQVAMNLPGGVADQLRGLDPAMIKMQASKHLVIPAYSGPTQPKYAQPVPVSGTSKTKE
jgi:uncharacterized protein YlxW (UPF0749 family)